MSTQNKLYPHPTIVVGVGKFGLSCLEFLGEKWISRKSTGGDTSCRNLRLLHLDYNEKQVDPTVWPKVEKRISDFLSQMRTDDMPELSLDMLILRTMGLIRFRDGHFQACYPKDGGFISMVEEDGSFRFPTAYEKDESDGSKLYRQKYFEWVSLGTDPLVAVQNLAELRSGNSEYDHFVGAILHRVRLGHSPNIILRMIFRSMELCEHGVDPSPWSWVHEVSDQYTPSETVSEEESFKRSVTVGDTVRYTPFLGDEAPDDSIAAETSREAFLKGGQLVEEVGQAFFNAWGELLPAQFLHWDEEQQAVSKNAIQIPNCNLFRTPVEPSEAAIYTTPYQNMYNILKQDFSNKEGEDALRLLPVSDFQLGMIDSDSWDRDKRYYAHLNKRLKEYGRLTYQGLLLLWSNLEQAVTVDDFNGGSGSHQDVLHKSIKQSLAFLGELMVKKHLFGAPSIHAGGAKRQPTDVWTDGLDLPTEASNQLQRAQVNSYSGQSKDIQELYERLIEIGVPIEESQEITRNLYNRIDFDPKSLNPHIQDIQMGTVSTTDSEGSEESTEHHISDKDFLENQAVLQLRQRINAELRHLYSLDNLRNVNKGIHRQPPALKVFVVADFHDPFARVALQPLLKSISAEIFRTIHSVFQIERGGVWKNTSVVPLIWLPNPTDPTVGEVITRERRNRESAVSLYAVHSLRKWLESIPKHSCNFRQIFLNSRMTDNAYLGTRDATTQTAHFIEYQITNQFSDVKDLDATKAFISADSVFASFACQLIDFPETRTREYLATLLGLDFLQRVRDNRSGTDRFNPTTEETDETASGSDTSQELKQNISDMLDQQATSTSNRYKVRFPELETTLESVFSTLTPEHLQNIKGEVRRSWNTFVSDSGHLDSMLRSFHIDTEKISQEKIENAFANTNEQFISTVANNGVDKARQFLNQQKFKHDEDLRHMDDKIQAQSKVCKSQGVPKLNVLDPMFEDIKAKSLERLDLRSQGYMTFIFALWCAIGISSLVWMTMQYLEMQNNPSVFEWLVWRILPVALIAGACVLFQRLLRQKAQDLHDEFLEASNRFDKRLQELFVADSDSLYSFFGSRSDLSLMNKQREYNSNAVEQAVFDQRLGERFQQSVDLQETLLQQHLEELGVRLTSGSLDEQDPSLLFTVYSANYNYNLLRPEIIRQHYLEHCPPDSERFWSNKVGGMLKDLGDLEKWRVSAPLSNTNMILDYGRNEEEFQQFVDYPLIKQDQNIRDDLFYNIMDFILVNHPNIGVGADFDGYRGLDSNNVQSVTCKLVLHEDMQKGLEQEVTRVIEHKSDRFEDAERIRTIIKNARVSKTIRSNSVCLYSISTGISTRIIQNLKRFHTPLERVEPVLETLFPFGAEVSSYQANKRHLNPLPPFGNVDMDWVGQKIPFDPSNDEAPHEGERENVVQDESEVDLGDETSSGDKS